MVDKLEVKNLTISFSDKTIIDDVSFNLTAGHIGCLLGASGCGKTTLLRAIAGFEQPVDGEIRINDQCVSSNTTLLKVEQRNVGMVFQDFVLFPHLTVQDNIAFGLQKLTKDEQEVRSDEVIQVLKITEFRSKYPHQLSGGQQQRVAIARAIAPRPEILLLDEPFSNMDGALKEQVARETRNILKQDNITAILVTHNQLEAFAMADEIGVIQDGKLLQWDNAFDLYHRPDCAYVADFVGEGVFLTGTVLSETEVETELGVISGSREHGCARNEQVSVLIRPDDIIHDDDSRLTATVIDKAFRGAEFLYTLSLSSGEQVLSLAPSHHNHAIKEDIGIRLEIDHLVVFGSAHV